MKHSKSRFIKEARRVGTGAVFNRTYQVRGESVYLFLEFTIVFVLGHAPLFVVAQFIARSYASCHAYLLSV